MRNYIVLACLLALTGCSNTEPQRAENPAFKGMELYPGSQQAKTGTSASSLAPMDSSQLR